MSITYIDSGVLVAASRGLDEISELAISTLASPERELASSPFIKLEVLSRANYCRQTEEIEFYKTFFEAVKHWAEDLEKVIEESYNISCQYGLSAMNSMHVAAALSVEAEEFITTEKVSNPIYRVTELEVISLFES